MKEETILRKWFLRLVIASALLLWLITLRYTQPGHPEASPYWYASELYWTFWPGLICAAAAIFLSVKHGYKEQMVSIMLPVLFIYTLPSFTHDMVPVFDIYHVIPPVLDIIETGAVDFTRTVFPLSHIYYASNIMVLDLEALTFTRIYPTILASIIVLMIYTISRRVWSKGAVMAPLAFISLNWYMEYHMARQAYGLLIWVVFWLILYLYLETRDRRLAPLASLMLFCIIPAHPGMIIIAAINLTILVVLACYCLLRRRSWYYLKPSVIFPIVFLTGLTIAYFTLPDIKLYLTSLYDGIVEGGFQGFSMGGPSSASFEYSFVNDIRMVMGIIQSFVGLTVLFFYSRCRRGRALFFAAWFFGCYLWLGYSLTHNGYLIERAFLTALVPASVLIPLISKPGLIKIRRLKEISTVVVTVLMILFLLTIPITKNSVDALETPSSEVYHAGRFAQHHTDGRVNIMDTHEGLFRYLEATDDSSVSFRSGRSGVRDEFELGMTFGYHIPSTNNYRASYLIFTDYFNNYILIRYDNATAVDEIHRYEKNFGLISNKVFDAGNSRIYSRF